VPLFHLADLHDGPAVGRSIDIIFGMRLAVYGSWIYLKGGIERTLVELFRRSRHDWTLYTHAYDAEGTFPELASKVVELTPRVSVERSLRPLADAAWKISRTVLPEAEGLLVSSDGFGELILARNRMPAAVYCHTPLKILHDPTTRQRLRQRDPRKAFAVSLIGPTFKIVHRRLWSRYQHAFVASNEVRGQLEEARLVARDPIEILPYGVDLEWFTDDEQPREDFFLVAGRIKWWKNIELAIAGFAAARAQGCSDRLIITGIVDALGMEYLEALRTQARGLPIEFEVAPTQERLRELYRRCRALVFPSLNEDFGIVPLEAMACGAPVIAVDAGGPRETILPGVTGWRVSPTPEAFAEAMLDASGPEGKAEAMRAASRARASEFTWDRFATRIDDVMEQIVSEHHDPIHRSR
jgi:glycosyltransferase involved in cell wall biosynthesis